METFMVRVFATANLRLEKLAYVGGNPHLTSPKKGEGSKWLPGEVDAGDPPL